MYNWIHELPLVTRVCVGYGIRSLTVLVLSIQTQFRKACKLRITCYIWTGNWHSKIRLWEMGDSKNTYPRIYRMVCNFHSANSERWRGSTRDKKNRARLPNITTTFRSCFATNICLWKCSFGIWAPHYQHATLLPKSQHLHGLPTGHARTYKFNLVVTICWVSRNIYAQLVF